MQHSNTSSSISHEQAWDLLPWYVNGTLTPDERQLVEKHLHTCIICQTEHADIQVLSAYSQQCSLPELSPQASFNRLLQRIENDSAAEYKKKFSWRKKLGIFRQITSVVNNSFSPRPQWIAAVATLLLAVIPVGIWLMPITSESPSALYRTLSSPRPIENAANNDIHVIFAPDLSQSERSRILATIRAETIAGPNVRGVYWIRINAMQGREVDLNKAIAALRRETGVLFAEPAAPSGASFSDSGSRS